MRRGRRAGRPRPFVLLADRGILPRVHRRRGGESGLDIRVLRAVLGMREPPAGVVRYGVAPAARAVRPAGKPVRTFR